MEYQTPLPPKDPELETLENEKWDLMDKLAAVSLAIAVKKNHLKEQNV